MGMEILWKSTAGYFVFLKKKKKKINIVHEITTNKTKTEH